MIVIEGPDASGKTALAKHLAERYNIVYKKNPRVVSEHGSRDVEAADWADEHLLDQLIVVDRWFYISEWIYQQAQKEKPLLVNAHRMTEGILRVSQTVDLIVFCRPPWEVMRQTLQDTNRAALHGVDLLALEKIAWSYEILGAIFKELLYERVIYYDYTSQNLDHVYEAIVDLMPEVELVG